MEIEGKINHCCFFVGCGFKCKTIDKDELSDLLKSLTLCLLGFLKNVVYQGRSSGPHIFSFIT